VRLGRAARLEYNAPAADIVDDAAEYGVPQDDGFDDQVEAGCPIRHGFGDAVASFSGLVEKDGAFKSMTVMSKTCLPSAELTFVSDRRRVGWQVWPELCLSTSAQITRQLC
jgi:hypothetical protein